MPASMIGTSGRPISAPPGCNRRMPPSRALIGYHTRPSTEARRMWYAIIGNDKPAALDGRKRARPAHLQRLEALKEQGRLLLAGPFPAIDAEDPGPAGFSGSLIVAEFEDLAAANTWAAEDPYVEAGVYASVDVRPFRRVLP